MKDKLFKQSPENVQPFVFDKKVTEVFDDMLDRSIPFYHQLTEAIGKILLSFEMPEGKIYDLGSSTGALLCYLSKILPERAADMAGIDNSKPMIEKSREKARQFRTSKAVQFIYDDIENYNFGKCAVIIANFTLQFITPEKRAAMVKRLYDILQPGGLLIISEKVCFDDKVVDENFIDIYYNFKKARGYSDLEISNKREALENVLIPETIEKHVGRLQDAGFNKVNTFFQWFNFAGFLGIKNG